MAIRSQIRLDQLTGSLADAGAAAAALNASSLQGSLDALAAGVKRITGGTTFHSQDAGIFTHTLMKQSGSLLSVQGDLHVQGNDIKGGAFGDVTAITLSGPDVNIAGNVQVGGNVIKASDGGLTMTLSAADDKVTFLGNLDHADSNWSIGPTVTTAGSLITLGGGGTVVAGGDIRLATAGVIEDSGGQSRFTATNAGVTDIGRADGTTAISVQTDSDAHFAANVQVVGNVEASSNAARSIFAEITSDSNNITLGGGGRVVAAGDLQVNGNDIKSSTGETAITLQLGNVILPGDLTVLGATTAIDTTNLIVEDKIIGLGFTSGSKGGVAGKAGIVFSGGGGSSPAHKAIYFDAGGNNSFNFIQTAQDALSASLSTTAYLDIAARQQILSGAGAGDGGKIFSLKGAVPQLAITLTDDASATAPNVRIANHIELADDKAVRFGNTADGSIEWDNGSSALQHDVGNGHKFVWAVNAAIRAELANTGLQLEGASFGQLSSKASQELHVSSSVSQDLELKAGKDLNLTDKYRDLSSWSLTSGIKLATNAASWSNFKASFGEVSLLDAIASAGGGAGTLQKRSLAVTGSGFVTGLTVPMALDLDQLTKTDVQERVDVFVNGQLLASSSEVPGNGDYGLVAPVNGSSVGVIFQFDLLGDDVVTAVVR